MQHKYLFEELCYIEKHLKKWAILIVGFRENVINWRSRQIGKSYIIRLVGQQKFSNYIEINMEEDRLKDKIFENAKTTQDFYMALSIVAGEKMKDRENTLVFIDEIQAYDHLLTLVKFLMAEKNSLI